MDSVLTTTGLGSDEICRQRNLERVRVLLSDAWIDYGPQTNLHPGDLWWRLRQPGWGDRLNLWEDGAGTLIAVSSFDPPGDFEFQLHPRAYSLGLEAQILDWGEARTHGGEDDGPSAAPTTWGTEGDPHWLRLLESRGYIRSGGCCLHLLRGLVRDLPVPALPEGFRVRGITGNSEIAGRVAVHRAAFHPSPMVPDTYLRVVRSPGYRPELDVVVEAPDGRLAAFCLCWYDGRSHTGLLEPVGTDPEFRGRGLARAAVLEALRRLRITGASRAAVLTGEQNRAALGLYLGAGFSVDRSDWEYVRSPI